MTNLSVIDEKAFRRILTKNITTPFITGIASAILFITLIFNLLSSLKWVEHTQDVINRANELDKLTVYMQTGMRGYLVTGHEDFLSPYRLSKPKFAAQMNNLKELVNDNPPQIERLERIQATLTEWDNYAQKVINMRRNDEDFTTIVRTRGILEFEEIGKEFTAFQEQEKTLLKERNDHVQTVTITSTICYVIFIFLFKGLISFLGRRDLINLSENYSRTLAQRQEHAELLEKQSWQRAGQAKLAEQSIGQTAMPLLGRTVLNFLASYLNATVAAMYVRNDKSSPLYRIATYGVSKEKEQTEQSFDNTESLVGQTAHTNQLTVLENVPDHYLDINSGLGSTPPKNLVLLPIHHEGNVNGVIEIGFLNTIKPRDIEFLTLISPHIGSIIEASLYRRRLQDALEETQQLNEELQVQQEELRSSNEELEEQSRVLEESQLLLENQKTELEQSNEKLIKQTVALDEKNAALNAIQIQLEERATDLQRASKYKSEFLANMSHELRTPLNSSMILAKLLAENQKGNLDEEQIQFAQNIYSAGNDLLNLINDILDISKVEAGKLELAPEPILLPRLLDVMRMTFEPLAAQKHLKFTTIITENAPHSIFTDRQRLEQILKNLLSNAIKFTETGNISLTIAGAENNCISFAVKDTGIGIAPDQQKIIFEAFQQADGSINRRYGGTGLGLSISRDLAALFKGSITVTSTPGAGSTFTLLIPCELRATAQTMSPVASRMSMQHAPIEAKPQHHININAPLPFTDDRDSDAFIGRAVLVIEDNPEFARILYDLAHELQYRCVVALNATDGLEMASEYLPDAILLDIGLPDTSGMSVLQKLKSNPITRHIPVHIVSAADQTETALQMGAVGYAIKPTTREHLKEVFQKLEGKLTQQTKRVLLVEDDPRQRQSVTLLIGDDDTEITAVESGEEAIALLHDTIFDCMIIDLKLPDMQGHELLQRMSSEDICCFPPVIVYTGRNLTHEEENNLLKYSRSIIIKGARSPERLLDEVTLFLHKVESELSIERQSMLKTVRSRDNALDGRKILLVDDDVRNIFALTGALEQKGAIVEIARNGQEAINKLDEIPDIDLILMDVMMPVMDGLEATRRLRADPRFQKLPIIAVTAKAMKDDQEQCVRAGASDYLAKPIDIDRLYSLLRIWMPTMERL